MKRRNIVFVLNEYNGHGGAQRVAAILAEDFLEDGHHVAVLSINEQENEISYFPEKIPVIVLHKDGYRAPLPKPIMANLKSLKIRTVAKEIFRRHQLKKKRKDVEKFFASYGDEPVFVIVVQVWGMQWMEPLVYWDNIKIIGQSHESYLASKNSHRYKRIMEYYRQVDKFLLLTEKDAEHFRTQGFTNIGFMYNPAPFRKKNDPKDLYANKTIVSMGRLVKEKGFDVLIQAFARISSHVPDWKLHIYGEGPEKKSLQTLIDVLGMNDKIFLKGKTEQSDKVLSASSLFVLTSKAEGLPMSLIEAQSCGLPCISTDCAPGIREIIHEYENGFVTPVDDVPLISRHMLRIIKNPELYYSFSRNAFENSSKFERTNIRNKWYELFEELEELQNE